MGLEFSTAIWNAGFVKRPGHICLLTTLDKSGHGSQFQYKDHFVSATEFEWQSQNRTGQESRDGQDIRKHAERGVAVHLFVRDQKKRSGGGSAPFVYCGDVDFQKWEGDKPITVRWRLREAVPNRLWDRHLPVRLARPCDADLHVVTESRQEIHQSFHRERPGPDIRDRIVGCLTGLALGDALRTALEFTQPGTFEPIDDMVGGGPFGLEPGQWTDDTSMALCLADSLVECGGFDPADQMRRYVRWWRHGYVVHTLEAALWAFHSSSTFKEGALLAVNLGEDADTTATLSRILPFSCTNAERPERVKVDTRQVHVVVYQAFQIRHALRHEFAATKKVSRGRRRLDYSYSTDSAFSASATVIIKVIGSTGHGAKPQRS